MTICVGAMATLDGDPVVIGASDRMVTSGDIEFEQEQTKIIRLTSSICVMVAGDLTVQADVLHVVMSRRDAWLEEFPDKWISVKQVADWFQHELTSLIRERAVHAILAPLGLNLDKLSSSEMSFEFARQLAKELLDYRIETVQAIIMGIDSSGAHIYEANNNGVSCQDWTGFTSIGAGAWHSNSQMIFGGHVKSRNMAETLMLVYTSKKRAEVAPGVGNETDMILIGPGLGYHTMVGQPILKELEETYQRVEQQARSGREHGNATITKYIEEIIRRAAPAESHASASELQTELSSQEDADDSKTSGEEASESVNKRI